MAERLDVFTVIEKEGMEKKIYVRVGAAFVNRDDSLNIHLDALPVNGFLHARFAKPDKDKEEA